MQYFILAAVLLLGAGLGSPPARAEKMAARGATERAVLSEIGSGRATAYWEQNKIITIGDRTHVVWLDASLEGFRVRGRTLNRATGQWSPTVTIGEGQDNHGGPGLTVDSKGYLHILYYPHHEQLRYRRSLRPNDISEWEAETKFGVGLSYPVVICGPDDTLVLTARRGYHDAERKPIASAKMEQELWKKTAGGEWQRQSTIIRARHAGYAQFAVALAWGRDRKTIHLNCRIVEGAPSLPKPINTVAYMVSPDAGETWTRADGTPITLPATVDTIDVLAHDGGLTGPRLGSGPLGVDREGVPHLIYTANVEGSSRLYLATVAPGVGWTRRDLTPEVPEGVRGWQINLGMGGGLSFSQSGRATIVAVVLNAPPEERQPLKEWGHRTTEILRLWSDDDLRTFRSEILAPIDAKEAHWLPNIERATGHNQVPQDSGIIYTGGGPGPGLKDLELNNRVYWRPSN